MARRLWVFDVDGCLIDSLSGTALRPGAHGLLAQLGERGCEVHLWSAGGGEYARERAVAHGIDHLVRGFHDKGDRDAHGRYLPAAFGGEPSEVVFVDDRPEDLPIGADVIAVFPYLADNPHDRGLREIEAGLP